MVVYLYPVYFFKSFPKTLCEKLIRDFFSSLNRIVIKVMYYITNEYFIRLWRQWHSEFCDDKSPCSQDVSSVCV